MSGKKVTETPVFEKQDLENAGPAVFGVQPEVMAGALYGVTGSLSIDQARAKLEAFAARPITNEGGN